MTENEVNKVETLIGYLEYLYGKLSPLEQAALDHIDGSIKEANEWILEERNLNPALQSNQNNTLNN